MMYVHESIVDRDRALHEETIVMSESIEARPLPCYPGFPRTVASGILTRAVAAHSCYLRIEIRLCYYNRSRVDELLKQMEKNSKDLGHRDRPAWIVVANAKHMDYNKHFPSLTSSSLILTTSS